MLCLHPAIVCITTLLVLIPLQVAASEAADDSTSRCNLPAVVAEIRAEVTKMTSDPAGRPLPVAAHWANGFGRANFSSDYQISLLERGRHIVPELLFPRPDARQYDEAGRPWVEKLARWKAPFSLRAGQWESVLYEEEHPVDAPGKWRNLPPEKNPRVINPEGKLIGILSPWGAVEPWYEAGVYHTSSPAFRQLEQWYPNPPRPWTLEAELPVFPLARVLGDNGKHEWLVYAHAPVEARRNVRIEIPGYREVTVDVVPGGSFHLVGEEHGSVTPVAMERK
ncbi:MAG: hypothetical protein KJZ87_09670 [Thermoguttaceae bacterium]|nr:hypothetical protein [Thermoguttaceae bacterium]